MLHECPLHLDCHAEYSAWQTTVKQCVRRVALPDQLHIHNAQCSTADTMHVLQLQTHRIREAVLLISRGPHVHMSIKDTVLGGCSRHAAWFGCQ
jgi:hypothetical protein